MQGTSNTCDFCGVQTELYKSEFNRLVFGLNTSPFVAHDVVQEHARHHRGSHPRGAEATLESAYMDDSLDSTTTISSFKDGGPATYERGRLSELFAMPAADLAQLYSNARDHDADDELDVEAVVMHDVAAAGDATMPLLQTNFLVVPVITCKLVILGLMLLTMFLFPVLFEFKLIRLMKFLLQRILVKILPV